MNISFKSNINIVINDSSLKSILKAFAIFSRAMLNEFINQALLSFAVQYMKEQEKHFVCKRCGNSKKFIWKTKHGRKTSILTIFGRIRINQLQIECKECHHKFNITRDLLEIKPRIQIPMDTIRKLGLIGSLTSFRISEKITSLFGLMLNKMAVWRSVQKLGKEINFDLDTDEAGTGEADGTGIPIRGIKKRGMEMKVFVQKKLSGGVRIAGLSIGKYDSGWDKLFKPLIPKIKKFKKFLLVTDGDTSILKPLKKIVNIVFQRCLWHIPHQIKYYLWKDGVKRKSKIWNYILSEILDISAIRYLIEEEEIIEQIIETKLKRLDKLIFYCDTNGYKRSATYLSNAKNDMFTAIKNKLEGKTTSHAERVMRIINARINVGKWSPEGALNVNKIRLAYYYNGFDVD